MSSRVLFLDHAGELGGAELSLLELVSKLPCQSHVCLLSDGPFKKRLEEAGVSVEVIAGGSGLHAIRRYSGLYSLVSSVPAVLSMVWRVAKRSKDFDLIYANTQKAFVVAALVSIYTRQPVIWHLRDILDAEHFSSVTRRFVIFLANWRAKKIITNSNATGTAFYEAGGSKDITKVIYNSIDFRGFESKDYTKVTKLRNKIVPNGRALLGMFGRLAPWKGQHILIKALVDLPDVHAAIVGDSLFGEDKYKKQLKDIVSSLGLKDRVHFLGFRSNIYSLMKAMDIIVHASIAPEPFGRVVVEGMLSERPVIASKAGGVLEIIEHERTGLLVEPGNVEELIQAVQRLLDDQVFARSLVKQAKEVALSRFSLDLMISKVAEVISDVVSDSNRAKYQ